MLEPLEVLRLYPDHGGTLPGLLASRMASRAQHPLMLFRERVWTYAQFDAAAARLAGHLSAHGVAHGDRVACAAANSDEVLLLFFAATRIGAIFTPLNPALKSAEAEYQLRHAEPAAFACDAAAALSYSDALKALPTNVFQMVIGEEPLPERILEQGTERKGVRVLELARVPSGDASSDAVTTTSAPDVPDGAVASAATSVATTAVIIYTSGTTGNPKGVMHSHLGVIRAGEVHVERVRLQPHDRVMAVLPLYHLNALFYSFVGAMVAGATLVLTPCFSAADFWRIADDTGATQVNLIAAVSNILVRRSRSEYRDSHQITRVTGGPFSDEVRAVLQSDFHIPVVIEGFGMTEIPGALSTPFDGMRVPSSCGIEGRHPDPAVGGTRTRVVDDDGVDVAPGATGEMWVRLPGVMQGYFRDAGATAAAFTDGWFRTGDLMQKDAQGWHFYIARKKDIIRVRGENISGAELDRVIGAHPAVVEAASIGVPAPLGEEDILVVVVAKQGEPVSAEDIAAWCRARLAAIKTPRYVVFSDALPHTPSKRVEKFKLKADQALIARAVEVPVVAATPTATATARGAA